MSKENRFTPEQEAAINYRAGSLLVSSAAGSGKTMVLVERLLGYIEQGINIDRFLVITYTRAAASELRERIHTQLQKRLAQNPGNIHLRRQTMLCRGAHIETVHTYCSTLLRENAHLINLPPDFRIADENECEMIKTDVLDEVFSRTYDEKKDDFELDIFLEMYVDGRDDKKLAQIVKDIHGRMMSMPYPSKWISEQTEKPAIEETDDVSKTEFGGYLIDVLTGRVTQLLEKTLILQDKARKEEEFCKSYGQSIDELVEGIIKLRDGLMNGWDEAVKCKDIKPSRANKVTGYDELKAIRTYCGEELKKIVKYLDTKSADHINDLNRIHPAQKMLLQLVADFDEAYKAEKRKRGVVDFSDLEHLSLSLLYDEQSGQKTKLAHDISQRFTEILVDEYQDVNEVQETLFKMLSKEENNIFMVGDVKQSIYRFRLAEPAIFLEKYNKYEQYSEEKGKIAPCDPVKINLSTNFRSRKGILETTNHIFKSIMTEQFGEIDYNDEVALIAGRKDDEQGIQGKEGKQGIRSTQENSSNVPVEFDILSAGEISTSTDDEEDPTLVEIEAAYVARRIKELINVPYMIDGGNGDMRQVKYGDVAILLRAVKGRTWRFASALRDMNIPSEISGEEDFFDSPEIKSILSLLSVVDNPIQDIALAAVLSSPIYGMTSEELAEIRAANKYSGFYEAMKCAAEQNTGSRETSCKCKKILSDISEMRKQSLMLPSDRFIWHVYEKTKILDKVMKMSDGEVRFENLMILVQLARDFEGSGYKGLYSFLTFLSQLQERGDNVVIGAKSSPGGASGVDAVKIMSIHKSKGLEFPVVILADTAKKHNTMDLNKPVVFHKKMGIGSQITYPEKRIRHTTLAREAIKEKLKQEMLSEELRVLYVAMTRAKEKLIITATFDDSEKIEEKIKMHAGSEGKYPPEALMSMGTVAHWLIAGSEALPSKYGIVNDVKLDSGNAADALTTKAIDTDETAQDDTNKYHEQDDSDNKPKADTLLEFEYRYQAATELPSKLTVTALKQITDPDAENAPWIRYDSKEKDAYIRKPMFASPTGNITGAERGTLIHNIMRYIDYNKCSNESEIQKELVRLTKERIISESDASKIKQSDIQKITELFKSDIGKRMMVSRTLEREFKFSLLVKAEKYFPGGGDDEILMQGIIDCYFEENDGLVLIDYKTDRVNKDNIDSRTEKYTSQLNGYSEALTRICNKPVKERYIYFFETGQAIRV